MKVLATIVKTVSIPLGEQNILVNGTFSLSVSESLAGAEICKLIL
jgi:hypothetical protein